MRTLVALALVVAISGCAKQAPSREPVAFSVQGLRIGDPMPKDVAQRHPHESLDGELRDMTDLPNSSGHVSLVYLHGKLAAVELSFDDLDYYSFLDVYTEKLGEPFETDEFGATWQTTDGEFELRKDGSGRLWSQAYRDDLRRGNQENLKQLNESL